MNKGQDLTVFITTGDATCDECGEDLGRHAWITLKEDKGALCLSCADLDHLVYLPAGSAALTRRARKHSTLAAVVLRWSRARARALPALPTRSRDDCCRARLPKIQPARRSPMPF